MAFWSGERLEKEIPAQDLISPYRAGNLDCASYLLTVGEQVFATSDKLMTAKPADPIIQVLGQAPHHTLRIPPGQFAFLLTEEVIKVPATALALISMRAGYKLKGLINVSGFHVDPGWCGKLLFSVYNAGPAELVVERGDAMFLIVYADLDQTSSKLYNGKSQGQKSIKSSLLEGMGSQVFSPLMLQRKVDDLTVKIDAADRSLTTRMEAAERSIVHWKTIAVGFAAAAGLFFACVAIFATFVPATLGLIVGSMVQAGGYDLKFKAEVAPTSTQNEAAKALAPVGIAQPVENRNAKAAPIPANQKK